MGGKLSKSIPKSTPINKLCQDEIGVVGTYLSLQDMGRLARSSRQFNNFFQSTLDTAQVVQLLLAAVVRGNPQELVNANSGLLFKTGQITAPDGVIFYDVSPYQLMIFFRDRDMMSRVMPFISTAYESICRKQYAAIDRGGADLVKLDKDPIVLVEEGKFNEITQFEATYTIHNQLNEIVFHLLENPDGILYYQDETQKIHFYYANRDKQTVIEIEPEIHSNQEQAALEAFKASFTNMEKNSSRRSNNLEHQLIASTMRHKLTRCGIRYERAGVHYRDSQVDFNRLLNAYRKCIRLYREQQWNVADAIWRHEVGSAQREVMWLLQRLCEKGRPFYPLPDFQTSSFRRGLSFFNFVMRKEESVLNQKGLVAAGLGSNFALYKDAMGWGAEAARRMLGRPLPESDLVAISRLIEWAKAINAEEEMQDTDAYSLPRLG